MKLKLIFLSALIFSNIYCAQYELEYQIKIYNKSPEFLPRVKLISNKSNIIESDGYLVEMKDDFVETFKNVQPTEYAASMVYTLTNFRKSLPFSLEVIDNNNEKRILSFNKEDYGKNYVNHTYTFLEKLGTVYHWAYDPNKSQRMIEEIVISEDNLILGALRVWFEHHKTLITKNKSKKNNSPKVLL